MECGAGCGISINNVTNEAMSCRHCSALYHWKCLRITREQFHSFSSEYLKTWTCPACRANVNNVRRPSRPETPVRASLIPDADIGHDMSLDGSLVSHITPPPKDLNEVVTMKKMSALLDQKLQTSVSAIIDEKLQQGLSSFMSQLRAALQDDIKSIVKAEIKPIVEKLEKDFTDTTDFICESQKTLESRIAEKSAMIEKLQSDNIQLSSDLHKIQGRLSSMENLSRSYNIEIQAVPETKSENLVTLLKQLSSTIGLAINDTDIIACRRVAKIDPHMSRPRNILVTFTSPRLRDSIISLASRFNKGKTNEDKLNTSHLGLNGTKSRVYVTEHISPECKLLYNQAKKIRDSKKYKYVWVKFGRVYLRKNDDSSPIHIKNVDCLNKLQ